MLARYMAIPAKSVKNLLNFAGDFHVAFVAVHAKVLSGVIDKVVMAENTINFRMILVVEPHWQHGCIRNLALANTPK